MPKCRACKTQNDAGARHCRACGGAIKPRGFIAEALEGQGGAALAGTSMKQINFAPLGVMEARNQGKRVAYGVGEKRYVKVYPLSDGSWYCPDCGYHNKKGAKQCLSCGRHNNMEG